MRGGEREEEMAVQPSEKSSSESASKKGRGGQLRIQEADGVCRDLISFSPSQEMRGG